MLGKTMNQNQNTLFIPGGEFFKLLSVQFNTRSLNIFTAQIVNSYFYNICWKA